MTSIRAEAGDGGVVRGVAGNGEQFLGGGGDETIRLRPVGRLRFAGLGRCPHPGAEPMLSIGRSTKVCRAAGTDGLATGLRRALPVGAH